MKRTGKINLFKTEFEIAVF